MCPVAVFSSAIAPSQSQVTRLTISGVSALPPSGLMPTPGIVFFIGVSFHRHATHGLYRGETRFASTILTSYSHALLMSRIP